MNFIAIILNFINFIFVVIVIAIINLTQFISIDSSVPHLSMITKFH